MEQTQNNSFLIYLFVGVLALFLLLCFAFRMDDFIKNLKYENMEIKRTDGKERKYWKKQRRKMWFSLILFYRG